MDEVENFIEAIKDDLGDYRDIVDNELESYSLVKELLSEEAQKELLEEYELNEEMDYERRIGKLWTLNVRRANFKTIEDFRDYKYPKLVLSIIANYWSKVQKNTKFTGRYSFPGDPVFQKKKRYRIIYLITKEMVLYYARFLEILEEEKELYYQIIRKMIVFSTLTFKFMKECEEIEETGFFSREHREKCKQYVELRVERSYLYQKMKELLIKRKVKSEKIEEIAENSINDALWAIYIQWEIDKVSIGFYLQTFEERVKDNYKESKARRTYQQIEYLLTFIHDMTEGVRPELDDKESMIVAYLMRCIKILNFLWENYGGERITGLGFTRAYILYEKNQAQILKQIEQKREYVTILMEFFIRYHDNDLEKIGKEMQELLNKANKEQEKIIQQFWTEKEE